MTLMSNRCTSARGGEENGLYSSREPPFGINTPQFFYVYQKKPQPLAPLKAWRGYKGNVYFEPMQIQKVHNVSSQFLDDNDNNGDDSNNNNNNNHTSNFTMPKKTPNRSTLRSAPLPNSRNSYNSSSHTIRSLLSSSSSSSRPYRLVNSSSQQVYVMDKTMMMVSAHNPSRSADLDLMGGVEAIGSLSVPESTLTRSHSAKSNKPFINFQQPNKDKRLLYKRENICRGSNFHKSKEKSELGINRNNTSKVLSIKISDPKKKLITPDNSRRTSGSGSRMSMRKQIIGSASSQHRADNRAAPSDLVVSGGKFTPPSPKVTISPMADDDADLRFPMKKEGLPLDGMDAFINANDNLPRVVNQVHVTLGQMDEEDEEGSLRETTPAFSDNDNDEHEDNMKQPVEFVDMNFKGLTTGVSL